MALTWPHKDPDETLDYEIDWTARLVTDDDGVVTDPIATSEWIVPDGLTSEEEAKTDATTTIWLSGGTAGTRYDVLNRITTVESRIMDQTVRIRIKEK